MRRRRYANSYRPGGATLNGSQGGPPKLLWLGLIPVAIVGIFMIRAFMSDGSGDGDLVAADPDGARDEAPCVGAGCPTQTRTPPRALILPTQTPSATPRAPLPQHTGASVLIVEEPCGAILYQSDASARLAPASLTKMMTALVTVDNVDLDEVVTVTVDGPALSLETDSTVMGIEPGQLFTVRDLLYGLLLPSGNDAAIQLAEYVAGTQEAFVEMMNDKAESLGLRNTHFANAHGLDDPNLYTSAADMAIIGRVLLRNSDLAEIVGTQVHQPAWSGPELQNVNLLLGGYTGAIGVKTGYTDLAHQTIVAAADDEGRRVIVVLLRSDDIYSEAPRLLDWAFESNPAGCPVAAPAG
jgi:D-alanyl-D-alanine carboxypeptidase